MSHDLRLAAFICLLLFGITATSTTTFADPLSLNSSLIQGGMVTGAVPPGSQVFLGSEILKVAPDGRFVFGFHRDAPPKAEISVIVPDGEAYRKALSVRQRDYKIQRVDGLPPKKVTPPPEFYERLRRERGLVGKARAANTDFLFWAEPFIRPAKGRISGVYGSQRILNGIPKQPHYGLDIAAPKGTPVVAPASGVVVLAEPDFYYEGGIIIIDHGFRVMSTLFHLNSVDVEAGQTVSQGDRIGSVGATGRATGSHVDWRINWGPARLDPELLPDRHSEPPETP